jgi:hypothetical protein
MPYILSLDPGKATGWAYGHYSNHHPYSLEGIGVIQGGLDGFVDWWSGAGVEYQANVVVIEGFRLRGSNNFTAALDGVEIIGYLKGTGRILKIDQFYTWQWPTDKALVPDSTVKALGFWQTGKMVNHTDGRDANDAIIHGLAYLIKQKHEPTVQKILEVTS